MQLCGVGLCSSHRIMKWRNRCNDTTCVLFIHLFLFHSVLFGSIPFINYTNPTACSRWFIPLWSLSFVSISYLKSTNTSNGFNLLWWFLMEIAQSEVEKLKWQQWNETFLLETWVRLCAGGHMLQGNHITHRWWWWRQRQQRQQQRQQQLQQ